MFKSCSISVTIQAEAGEAVMPRDLWFITILALSLGCSEREKTPDTDPLLTPPMDAGSVSDKGRPIPGSRLDIGSTTQSSDSGTSFVPPDATMDATSVPQCEDNCSDGLVAWGQTGGLTAYDVRYEIRPCREQRMFVETPFANNPEENSCERTVPNCAHPLGDIFEMALRQLNTIRVQNICAQYGVFGVDTRPVDGQVFLVQFDNQECLLGDACDPTDASCQQRPQQLVDLSETLLRLGRDMEENDPNCADLLQGL